MHQAHKADGNLEANDIIHNYLSYFSVILLQFLNKTNPTS